MHQRYNPEIRDRILGQAELAQCETTYLMLTPSRLRALAEIESRDWPVLSCYLQLSPERRLGGAWRTFFSSHRDAALKPIDDRRRRAALQDEFDGIGAALEAELPALGRGVAFIACRKLGLWRQLAVPIPLPDGVHRQNEAVVLVPLPHQWAQIWIGGHMPSAHGP